MLLSIGLSSTKSNGDWIELNFFFRLIFIKIPSYAKDHQSIIDDCMDQVKKIQLIRKRMKNDIFSISFFLNIRFMIPIANHVDGRKIYFILFYIEPFFSRLSVRQRINMIKWITGAEKKLDQKIWHCVWYALVFFQFITVLLFVFFFFFWKNQFDKL